MKKVVDIDKRYMVKVANGYGVYSPLYGAVVGYNSKKVCLEWIASNNKMKKEYEVLKDEEGFYIIQQGEYNTHCSCHPETCCCPNDGITVHYEVKKHRVEGNIRLGDIIRVDIRHVHKDVIVK